MRHSPVSALELQETWLTFSEPESWQVPLPSREQILRAIVREKGTSDTVYAVQICEQVHMHTTDVHIKIVADRLTNSIHRTCAQLYKDHPLSCHFRSLKKLHNLTQALQLLTEKGVFSE